MNTIKFITTPSEYFTNPADIVKTNILTDDEKRKALASWKQTCMQLLESSDEGMIPIDNPINRLSEVKEAIRELKCN